MEIVITVAGFTFVVLVVTWWADRLRISAPLALMLVGVAGSLIPFLHVPALSPELVLVGLLPPLLYAAAVNTPLADFRSNVTSIGWLSIGLVLFTMAGVAAVVRPLLDVPWPAAFAIGAVVAPPDAVAATAVARQVGLPRRVVTILEGESLVNDATALVSLRSATLALTAALSVGAVVLDFGRAVVLAIVIGLGVARLAGLFFRRLRDAAMTVGLSFLVPFTAYVLTELVHGSGVLAVVVAGIVLGHRAQREQTAEARLSARINWHTLQFLLENAVFLLIGLQTRQIVIAAWDSGPGRGTVIAVCLATLGAVILLRLVWLLGTRAFLVRRGGRPWAETLVIGWAGMRGVVTLAAAMTLPLDTPGRPVLVLVALVVTIGTLLIQGLTLPPLARALRLRGPDAREDAIESAMILQRATAAGLDAADSAAGPEDRAAVDLLRAENTHRLNTLWERLGRPGSEQETPEATRRRLRRVALGREREVILDIRDEGNADQTVVSEVLNGLDLEEVISQRFIDRSDAVRGALAVHSIAEPCSHLQEATDCAVPTSYTGCPDCEREGLTWVHLRMCLACGNIGCCDSSPGNHARKHFEHTGHPVMRSFEPGESWRWCYLDEVISD
ncbi:cation:proton antiporter [Raineyella sp. W15-4]|uniref:cation:proton antiporter domain-containing protein n=1 Tax=Raineyella sp. W15-4 TaxID=3081651 RepID=UPI00295369AF|nr:cation:proton antiporter [Raineyella sp. W15-4]WOQ17176.1 cation:proton antiporter [Raineyella sp. W15-4]